MGLLDAIDKLLEPITKRIFASKVGKSIRPLTGKELRKDDFPDYTLDPFHSWSIGNIFHHNDE
jgi:hypothetical protein